MNWWWVAAWWLSGVASFMAVPRDHQRTWGELLLATIVFGWFGPIIFVVIALVMIGQAEFWHKPIFPQRDADG